MNVNIWNTHKIIGWDMTKICDHHWQRRCRSYQLVREGKKEAGKNPGLNGIKIPVIEPYLVANGLSESLSSFSCYSLTHW